MRIVLTSVVLASLTLGCADSAPPPRLGAHLAGARRGEDVSGDDARAVLRGSLGPFADELDVRETARYGPLLAGTARVARSRSDSLRPADWLPPETEEQRSGPRRRTIDLGAGAAILSGPDSATVLLWKGEWLSWAAGPGLVALPALGDLMGPALPEEARPVRFEFPYDLGVRFGELGPRLVELGVLDLRKLEQAYVRMGRPLTDAQRAILAGEAEATVRLAPGEERFLLDFFWALGLANRTRFLTDGPMMRQGTKGVTRFASTGGWPYGSRPVTEFYASADLLPLSEDQAERLRRVAQLVYRPCCDNATAFPDCNHGMAMLGMLTLLASDDADEARLLEAARHANLLWYPAQTAQVVHFLNATLGPDQAGRAVSIANGRELFSGSGFRGVRGWLAGEGMLVGAGGRGAQGLAC